jgi:predicted permease
MSPAESLVSVFLVILVGWAVTARGFVREEQWAGLNWVAYYVFYPALIVDSLARATLSGGTVVAIVVALGGGVLAIAGATLALKPALAARGVGGPGFTSVLQGAARWQTFVAFALGASLIGRDGVAYVSVAVVAMIPLLNVIIVAALLRWGEGAGPRRSFASELGRNPFIVSCLVGIAFNLLGITGPAALFAAFDVLGKAGLAAALILTGASLRIADVHRLDAPVVVATALKLVAMPAVVFALARLMGLSGPALVATMVCASVPTAAAAVILAKQMGGDVPLMARIATVQTLAAALTMPAWLWLAGA